MVRPVGAAAPVRTAVRPPPTGVRSGSRSGWAVATGIHASTRVSARRGPATVRFRFGLAGTSPHASPHTKETSRGKQPPKVAVVLQALIHHTAGHRRIWKDLRHGSQVLGEP
ncbi:hypothetical protein STAFG_5329 [Streptomyces afghaniensis 772]|uniref:Uncharacterized protein n=1 Tax=Streptomyces afghaniensis 772 TaxID=1283301 RepID=S4MDK2_9ACTN|nr:hypothetical protein STAFG_5329 [Streptomyces afghaniensis 772]